MDAKILIVEDELLIAENHKDKLASFGINEIKIALSVKEARGILQSFTPDLVLLDVRLQTGFEGIDFGMQLRNNYTLALVFITAHADVTTLNKILTVQPDAYLSKPIRTADLHSAISIALRNKVNETSGSQILVQNGGETLRFHEDEFLYAKSSGNYVQLFFKERKRQVIRMTLEQLLKNMQKNYFIKINRSTIVNLRNIVKIKGRKLFVADEEFSISPNAVNELQNRMRPENLI